MKLMLIFAFASLTYIVIYANKALINFSFYRKLKTSITLNVLIHYKIFSLYFFLIEFYSKLLSLFNYLFNLLFQDYIIFNVFKFFHLGFDWQLFQILEKLNLHRFISLLSIIDIWLFFKDYQFTLLFILHLHRPKYSICQFLYGITVYIDLILMRQGCEWLSQ